MKTTLDRYSHAIPDLQTEVAEKTDALLPATLAAQPSPDRRQS